MSDKKMQTQPYGIEDRKVKIQKIMTQEEKKENDKKYGIGLYAKRNKKPGILKKVYNNLFNNNKDKKYGQSDLLKGKDYYPPKP